MSMAIDSVMEVIEGLFADAELSQEHWEELARKVQVKAGEKVWTKEELDAVINRWFPENLGVFYAPGTFELAAVEDTAGNMWRVWADGDTQEYTR